MWKIRIVSNCASEGSEVDLLEGAAEILLDGAAHDAEGPRGAGILSQHASSKMWTS